MTVADLLQDIVSAQEGIRLAAVNLGATLPAGSGLKDFAPAISAIDCGGSTPPVVDDWPADWPDISGQAENTFAGLVKVVEDPDENWIALKITAGGDVTIDWGDGTAPTIATSGAVVEHQYAWKTGVDPLSTGYQTATMVARPVDSTHDITAIDLIHLPDAWFDRENYSTIWLDLAINAPVCTSVSIGQTLNVVRFAELRQISQFDTAVTNAASMFDGCSSLQRLPDGATFAAVTEASGMFYRCSSLQRLPDGATFAAVTNAASMFDGCSSLQRLPDGATFESVSAVAYMFSGCSSLQRLPDGATFAAVTEAYSMFDGCSSLQRLPDGATFAAVTEAYSMFDGCSSLQRLPDGATFESVSAVAYMFSDCSSLQRLPDGATFAAVTEASGMFYRCSSLQRLPDGATFAAVTEASGMFYRCSSLQSLLLPDLEVGFGVQGAPLGASALNALFTSLPAPDGAQTISIAGTSGRLTCDITIATTKGWTVTT